MKSKIVALIAATAVFSAGVTSWAWWSHFRKTVTFLTVTSLKTEIYSDLNTLKALPKADLSSLREQIEERLAVNCITLAQVAAETNADRPEVDNVIRALTSSGITNQTVVAAIADLRERFANNQSK